jgi:hypothetical protein
MRSGAGCVLCSSSVAPAARATLQRGLMPCSACITLMQHGITPMMPCWLGLQCSLMCCGIWMPACVPSATAEKVSPLHSSRALLPLPSGCSLALKHRLATYQQVHGNVKRHSLCAEQASSDSVKHETNTCSCCMMDPEAIDRTLSTITDPGPKGVAV